MPRFFLYPSLLLGAGALVLAPAAEGHEIPADVTVHVWIRPAGDRLQVLLRAPLRAIRDIDFPERGGYLDVERLAPLLPGAAKASLSDSVDFYEDGRLLAKPAAAATQISVESDHSFAGFEQALARVTTPKPDNGARLVWNQVLLDALFEIPIRSASSGFSVRPRLDHLATRVVTVMRFVHPGGTVRAYEFTGDPGVVAFDPSWRQAAGRFIELGFRHILDGADHLLFLFCLVIPLRRLRPLLLVVTAFTVAHSITLIASAFHLGPDALWFPPLIETLIAASIVYMAIENIAGAGGPGRRWMIAFGFGLVHGFGFAFALRQTLQFAGSHLLVSLLSFNLGVELGQCAVLLLLVPLLQLTFRFVLAERAGTIVLSALVAHTGWHWMAERWGILRRYKFEWPPVAIIAGWLGWTLALLLAAAAVRTALQNRARRRLSAAL